MRTVTIAPVEMALAAALPGRPICVITCRSIATCVTVTVARASSVEARWLRVAVGTDKIACPGWAVCYEPAANIELTGGQRGHI